MRALRSASLIGRSFARRAAGCREMVMPARLLRGFRAPQPLHHLRIVPLHRTQMPADLAALAVDEEARRQAGGLDSEGCLRRRIEVQGGRLDAPPLGELAGG